jgi:hypothetical protein
VQQRGSYVGAAVTVMVGLTDLDGVKVGVAVGRREATELILVYPSRRQGMTMEEPFAVFPLIGPHA